MAIKNEQVTVAVCDACEKRTYGDPGARPRVLAGKAEDRTGTQVKVAEWSACKPQHVGQAVTEALKKAAITSLHTYGAATAS